MTASDTTPRPIIKNFREVTTLNDSIWNVLAFSFDFFPTGSNGNITDRDIIQLHWVTATNTSRGLITLIATEGARGRNIYQGNQTSDGAMRYYLSVNAGELGEGPLQLTLSGKLQCLRYNNYYCSRSPHRYGCICTQWRYERQSETIPVNGSQGTSSVSMCMQDTGYPREHSFCSC